MALPIDVDASFADDTQDPGVKAHQQHHDEIHAAINSLNDAFTIAVTNGYTGTLRDWLLAQGITNLAWDSLTNSVTSSTGAAAPIPVADATTTGLLSSDDKQRLDSLSGFIHTQGTSSAQWTITHNLGRYPSVTVVDSAGSVVVGGVTYIDEDTVSVQFSAPFSGRAYLS